MNQKSLHLHLQKYLAAMRQPMARRRELGTALALAKDGYFQSKDAKIDLPGMQKEATNLDTEIKLMVSAFRAGIGNRPISMKLSSTFNLTATITTGVVNTVNINGAGTNRLRPDDTGEWSSLSALFEEYKMEGGEVHWAYAGFVAAADFKANVTASLLPIIAYDADDATSASSTVSLANTAQHRIYPPVYAQQGAVATTQHAFRFVIPPGPEVNSGATLAGTEWIAVATPAIHGYIKHYHVQSGIVAADNVASGVIYYHLRFRCRA